MESVYNLPVRLDVDVTMGIVGPVVVRGIDVVTRSTNCVNVYKR